MFDLFPDNKLIIEWKYSAKDIDPSIWHDIFPDYIEGQWWYETLEKSQLEDQFRFLYALVKYSKEVVAIAPAFVMDVPIDLVMPDFVLQFVDVLGQLVPHLRYQRTFFIGSPCAKEGIIGFKKDARNDTRSSTILLKLHEAVERKASELKASMVVYKDFPNSFKNSLNNLAAKKDLFAMPSYPGTTIELADHTMESYLKGLKGSRRHNLKKKLKKSKELAELTVSVIQRPDEESLQEIFALFSQTYERGKTKFEKLNIKFFQEIACVQSSWFVLLREKSSNALVAFMLCFNLKKRIINKFIGLDYSKPIAWSLYFRLWEAALSWVLAEGAAEFQSGQTGYRFKIDVGNSLIPLTNYCKHTNPLLNLVFAKVAKEVSWASLDQDLKVYLQAHPQCDP